MDAASSRRCGRKAALAPTTSLLHFAIISILFIRLFLHKSIICSKALDDPRLLRPQILAQAAGCQACLAFEETAKGQRALEAQVGGEGLVLNLAKSREMAKPSRTKVSLLFASKGIRSEVFNCRFIGFLVSELHEHDRFTSSFVRSPYRQETIYRGM